MRRLGLCLAIMLAGGDFATAADYQVGALRIENPWARATPRGATVAGAYMKITNTGTETDRLTCVSAEISDRCEIHMMAHERGVMIMRPLPHGLEIKPGETVELKPGSFHVMFIDLKQAPERGRDFKGVLKFEKAGEVEVRYAVAPIGAPTAPAGMHGN